MRVAVLAVGLVLAGSVGTVAVPSAEASFHEDTSCDPGAKQMLQGGGTGDVMLMNYLECNDDGKWVVEATFRRDESTLAVWEPRNAHLDYSTFSSLDPFAGLGYVYSKARDLFPGSEGWPAVLGYANAALSAKPRAVAIRDQTSVADACIVVPVRRSDDEIREGGPAYNAWLPPLPAANGRTGTISYALADNLTAEQRSTVLSALSQYDEARQGTRLPEIVVFVPDHVNKPTITFVNGQDHFSDATDDVVGESVMTTKDVGRDGLARWKSGNIFLTPNATKLSEAVVAHELLHVEGFGHTPFDDTSQTMNRIVDRSGTQTSSGWNLDAGASPDAAFDTCTKAGMGAAD